MFDLGRIKGPTEFVPYSDLIKSAYPIYAIQTEPFIGYKVLLKDMDAFKRSPSERMAYIESKLCLLNGMGCFLRETNNSLMPDGFWLISMPVPRSQIQEQIQRITNALTILEEQLHMVRSGQMEINVSGKCSNNEIGTRLARVSLIDDYYAQARVVQPNSPYSLGRVVPINDGYILLRSSWAFDRTRMYSDMILMSQIISSIY